MTVIDQPSKQPGWKVLRWYIIPAIPMFLLYLLMGPLAFRWAAEHGWWPADTTTDLSEAQIAFLLGAYGCGLILLLAVPLITALTPRGWRLRVNGVAVLLLVIALPIVSWGIGLAMWFL